MIRLIISIILISFSLQISGQERSELEKRRKVNRRAMDITREIIKQTREQKAEGLQALVLLEQQIKQRMSIVESMNSELDLLEVEIDAANEDIAALKYEIDQLKDEFSSLLYEAYKIRRKHGVLYFLLSSNSFNQAIKRLHFIRELVAYRKKQLKLIVAKQRENSGNIFALIKTKNSKLSLFNERKEEMVQMEDDQEAAASMVERLKGKESELKSQLSEQKKIAKKLDRAIQLAIEEELRRTKDEEARAANDRDISEEHRGVRILSGTNFNRNKGALPWPVDYGYISQQFGRHKHPKLKNITTENNGVNIATRDGESVKAVFEGRVSAVMQIPGMKNSVLIKHGEYFTVYANLDETSVSSGTNIKRGESLGKVYKGSTGLAEFHFEIWKGSSKLNPEPWLGRL